MPAVKFHRGNGEESISLLDETTATTAVAATNEEINNEDIDNTEDVTLSNELLEYDQLY